MTTLRELADRIGATRLPELAAVADSELIELQTVAAEVRRKVDAMSSLIAAEIARRSTRAAGYSGLAQRLGARSADRLVERLAGVSRSEARALVDVGRIEESSRVGAAVRDGTLSVGQASAIARGLGEPTTEVPVGDLEAAAARFVDSARGLTIDELRARARESRDDLDHASASAREANLRERRYLHLIPCDDGMTRLTGLLDPESAARVRSVVDAATSPRRGGPRFVDPDRKLAAQRLVDDQRTTAQISLDALVDTLAFGDAAIADGGGRVPAGAPVQVVVLASELQASDGVARIDGVEVPVSSRTARRRACADGVLPIVVDSLGRRVLDLGRTRRLFSRRQREVLAARDGGCRMPGCDAPPGWCEAHHLLEWSRGGHTDIDNGVLLCRFHHLLVHDNGWRIDRVESRLWLVPPDGHAQTGRQELPSKSAWVRRLAAIRECERSRENGRTREPSVLAREERAG